MNWNRGLLLAAILIAIGAMAVVSSRSVKDRFFAIAALTQGIVVVFVVSGSFHQRSELSAMTVALMIVCGLWCLWDRDLSPASSFERETECSGSLSLQKASLTEDVSAMPAETEPSEGME